YFFMAAYEHVRDGGNETSQMNLSAGLIAKIRLPVPRIDEQVAVVLFLDSEIANLDGLTAEAERSIACLQERRTALISAAVTGKIDVRRLAVACAAPTPEPAWPPPRARSPSRSSCRSATRAASASPRSPPASCSSSR